jgi:hypothetical protein
VRFSLSDNVQSLRRQEEEIQSRYHALEEGVMMTIQRETPMLLQKISNDFVQASEPLALSIVCFFLSFFLFFHFKFFSFF